MQVEEALVSPPSSQTGSRSADLQNEQHLIQRGWSETLEGKRLATEIIYGTKSKQESQAPRMGNFKCYFLNTKDKSQEYWKSLKFRQVLHQM
jgi:hypothetical protein